ncbi:MAG: hypothetical protein V7K38_26685 [Nostoc sp.]|uniref:hypothetical protein n=1 Tax=Nostoc sp. TaxID=1180 RepID=UPI002FFC180E
MFKKYYWYQKPNPLTPFATREWGFKASLRIEERNGSGILNRGSDRRIEDDIDLPELVFDGIHTKGCCQK